SSALFFVMRIEERTFLVTGGASGLGAACVERLAESGANIVIADLNGEHGAALAARWPNRAQFVETDVTDEASTRQAIETACQQFGELAGAVHCAGIVAGSRVLGRDGPHDLGLFSRVVQVNLIGTFNVVRLAAAAIAQRSPEAQGSPEEDGERGVIVTTSSAAAFESQIGQAAYAASKAGVAGMTLPIARELAAFGIRLVSIAPGIFDTPLMAGLPDAVRASLAGQAAFPPRLGRPSEFASLAVEIIENPMLNAAVIRLDGGLRMAAK
ncbi:MAG TPA: SDR family NAD(P)-dependent oxidoreductase, partial [Pirellulales bacterium]|nr:SDR family NAD(P)-dependent oxidoreductase [Pirellulales bacterium]